MDGVGYRRVRKPGGSWWSPGSVVAGSGSRVRRGGGEKRCVFSYLTVVVASWHGVNLGFLMALSRRIREIRPAFHDRVWAALDGS